MSSPPRLRRGLVLLVVAFGAALALSYAWVVPRLVLDTEDTIFAQQLERLREQAGRPGATGETLEAPGVRVIRDLGREGPLLAAFLGGLSPGVHEFNDQPLPGLDTTQLIVAVEAGAGGQPVRWLLYDLSGLEALEEPWGARYLGAVGGGLALALVATLVGLLAARRLSGALADLELLVGSAPGAQVPAADQRDDEIGRIARLWRAAEGRLRSSLERERRFTRDASHELRTPMAAARGALELLRAEPEAPAERRAELLRRADAALVELGDLVQAFLWLAREPSPAPAGMDRELFPLGDLVARIVAERAQVAGTEGRLDMLRGGDALVEGSERLARVVIGNVIGNALHHGEGPVRLHVEGVRLVVRNATGPRAADEPRDGFGFGLEIAGDLCARSGWRLEAREGDGEFTVVLDLAGRPGSTVA